MTTLTDQFALDDLTAKAREVRFWHTAGAVAMFLLIWFGRLLGYAWLVPVICFLAIREGWRDVHPPRVSDGPARPR